MTTAMADKKLEKALYGPSTSEVVFGALLGLLAGVVAGAIYLVVKPVEVVTKVPAEPAKGVVYFVPGQSGGVNGRAWQAKVAAFTSGGSIVVNEEELNAWAQSLSGTVTSPKGAPPPEPANEFVSVRDLNFRLRGDRLQVAQRVRFNYFGVAKEVLLHSSGILERGAEGVRFLPEEAFLGSCPLHSLPGARGVLGRLLLSKQKVPEDFRAAWDRIVALEVEGGLLRVTTQP